MKRKLVKLMMAGIAVWIVGVAGAASTEMPSRPVEEQEPTLCGDIDKLAARLQKDGITDSLETTHWKETREGGSSAIGDMTLETILRTVLHAVTGSVFVAFVADLLGRNPRRRNARISDSFRTLRAIRAILAS